MSPTPLHPHYLHYSELPLSLRWLYSSLLCVLGLGYLFAMVNLFHTYAGKDGDPSSLSYEDIVIAYSGTGKDSRLEVALRGPMSTMLPADETKSIISWVQAGAQKPAFEQGVRPILDKRCMSCHDGSNPHLPNLNGFENVQKVTEKDKGADIFTLVRVSHIHLFGLTFIFSLVGLVFSHAYVRPVWLKCVVMVSPFVAVVIDILSWYFTKLWHPMAWVVMGGGALYGLSFGFMWFVSMWQMWIGKTPAAVAQRAQGAAGVSVG